MVAIFLNPKHVYVVASKTIYENIYLLTSKVNSFTYWLLQSLKYVQHTKVNTVWPQWPTYDPKHDMQYHQNKQRKKQMQQFSFDKKSTKQIK